VKQSGLPPEFERYRHEVVQGLSAADLVTAPTYTMLQALESHYLVLPRVRVIPNGRRADLYYPTAKEAYILSVGRIWDEAKNLAALAQSAPYLPWPVYLAGGQDHPEGGQAELDNVILLGQLPTRQLARWYERGSIYALPARYEPFGLSVLEAALCGCALVLGDIQSLRELWDEAAIFVPPDDLQTLVQTLLRLCSDHQLRLALGQQAQRRSERFTPTAMTAQYLEAYSAAAAHFHWSPHALGGKDKPCVL
jgi:glycosyltransferase involved in cell wall biosynthesis